MKENTKEKIINITMDLIKEKEDPEKITMREIADKAEVGLGLINYHFKNKETLIRIAVDKTMGELGLELISPKIFKEKDPLERFIKIIKNVSDYAVNYPEIFKTSIRNELVNGSFELERSFIKIFQEIYGDKITELDMKLKAIQIISFFQSILVKDDEFRKFTNINIYNKQERDDLTEKVIKSILV